VSHDVGSVSRPRPPTSCGGWPDADGPAGAVWDGGWCQGPDPRRPTTDPAPARGCQAACRWSAGKSIVSGLAQSGRARAGKTAMDEFAYCEPAPTRNPHNLPHTPGGLEQWLGGGRRGRLLPAGAGHADDRVRSSARPRFAASLASSRVAAVCRWTASFRSRPALTRSGFSRATSRYLGLAAQALVPGCKPWAPRAAAGAGVPDGFFLTTWTLDEGRQAFEEHVHGSPRRACGSRSISCLSNRPSCRHDRQARPRRAVERCSSNACRLRQRPGGQKNPSGTPSTGRRSGGHACQPGTSAWAARPRYATLAREKTERVKAGRERMTPSIGNTAATRLEASDAAITRPGR